MLIGLVVGVAITVAGAGVAGYFMLREEPKPDQPVQAVADQVALANAAREREYWVEVVRATLGTTDLCTGRPNPVDVAYRLGRAGAADVPGAGKAHEYALPIALAVAVGREEVAAEPTVHDDPMVVGELTNFVQERGQVTFFRATVDHDGAALSRSVAVARLPRAVSDNMARRLLLFSLNRRHAMTWDAHDYSEMWGGALAETFTVNTGYPAGAKKVLSPRMTEHLLTTLADGWIMAGEWLFVHREEPWHGADFPMIAAEMLEFLDLLPPAPRPSNEPLAFRVPLDEWERELVTLLEVREGIFERRVKAERRRSAAG